MGLMVGDGGMERLERNMRWGCLQDHIGTYWDGCEKSIWGIDGICRLDGGFVEVRLGI